MKFGQRIIKTLILGAMCFSIFGCSEKSETNNANMWIVNAGVPTQTNDTQEGQMYLDTSTYDIYQYQDGAWTKVGNIKGEDGAPGQDGNDGEDGEPGQNGAPGQKGEDGKTPVIEIIDGYWYIDGVNTNVKAEGDGSQTPGEQVNKKVSEEEFKAQEAGIGSFFMPTSVWRAHIAIDIQVQKGSTITFLGDLNNYRWGVIEIYDIKDSNSGYVDSSWNRSWSDPSSSYTTTLDGVDLYITIGKMNTSGIESKFTDADIPTLHSLFKIDAYKGKKGVEENSGSNTSINNATENMKSVNHRGACWEAPENTLSAYRKSYENGFKYVETDVLFTKDNIPVLLHDETIDRTSNGSGKIAELTYAQASQYDYSYDDTNSELEAKFEAYRGEKLPKFEEFIILCKRLGLHPYIEIKGTISLAQAKTLVDIVKKCGMSNSVSWLSFSSSALSNIVSIYSKARVGWVLNTVIDQSKVDVLNTVLRTGENEAFFDIWHTQDTDAAVNLCIDNDIPLEVWYCDKVDEILNLHPYVSGVTSNCLIAEKVLIENA